MVCWPGCSVAQAAPAASTAATAAPMRALTRSRGTRGRSEIRASGSDSSARCAQNSASSPSCGSLCPSLCVSPWRSLFAPSRSLGEPPCGSRCLSQDRNSCPVVPLGVDPYCSLSWLGCWTNSLVSAASTSSRSWLCTGNPSARHRACSPPSGAACSHRSEAAMVLSWMAGGTASGN